MPTELEELGAQVLGKESALFFPSGCMGNLASGDSYNLPNRLSILMSLCLPVMSHCWERGAEAILGDMSHIAVYEQVISDQLSSSAPSSQEVAEGTNGHDMIACNTGRNRPNSQCPHEDLEELSRWNLFYLGT